MANQTLPPPITQSPPFDYRAPATATLRARWIQWLNLFGSMLALLLIFGLFTALAPQSFPTTRNIETIARQTTIVAIAAMGMTLVIISGGIDLSVGSIIALVTVVIAWLLQRGFNPATAALGGILAGGVCGLLNGALITRLRVAPFIVTLGTLLVLRGAAKGMAGQQKIDAPLTALNDLLAALAPSQRWQIVPTGVWIMLALVALTALCLRYTRFGRYCVAIGSNEQTARLCGLRVSFVKVMVYAISGSLAGVAGLMQFSRLTVGDPTVAVGAELEVIAAVVIGGASLSGGEGSALGSLIGAAIMTTIRAGCSHTGRSNWEQEIITGVIIVLAVALDRLRQRRAAATGD
jgi:ribose transport system permease protein